MKRILKIQDTTLIGSWDEVTDFELSKITKRDTDTKRLDGLVIRGYETKFGRTNENGEQYAPGCLDKFVQSYFVDNGLNMVVDVQHSCGIDEQVGRVVYLEVNTVGFYFVVYIPRTVARYGQIKDLLQEGILQGFSKCGWSVDWEWVDDPDEEPYGGHWLVKEMKLVSVSLVTSPANAVAFEGMGETVRDRLEYRNTATKPRKKTILKSSKQ